MSLLNLSFSLVAGLTLAANPPTRGPTPKTADLARTDVRGQLLPDGALARLKPDGRDPPWALAAVAFAPDGKTLASGGADGVVRLWDTSTSRERRHLEGHRGAVKAVVFTPDGKLLASAGTDGTVHVWDATDGRQVRVLGGDPKGVRALACAPDGRMVASAGDGRQIRLWDVHTGEKLGRLEIPTMGGVYGLAFSADGKLLASGGQDRTARLWDLATNKERRSFKTPGWVLGVALSGDGQLLASGGQDQQIHLWQTSSGEMLEPLGGYEGPVLGIALSADGHTIFAANEDGKVRLWDVRTGKLLRLLRGHRGPALALALAPGGHLLATSSEDGTILVWEVDGLEAQWLDLGYPDVARRATSVTRMAADPGAVAFLKERLGRMLQRAFRVDVLVTDLASKSFPVRARATRELEALGELAESGLREALEEKAPLETQRRIRQILARLPEREEDIRYNDRIRLSRALVVLERIGTPEARRLLETVAQGPPRSRLTEEARAALKRLGVRPTPP
jgi:hypothetical protein